MGKRCVLQPHELAGEVNKGDYSNCPYGPGLNLWVRETTIKVEDHGYVGPVYLESDMGHSVMSHGLSPGPDDVTEVEPDEIKLRPSIFMPKSMSRILLEITGVRVERLGELTEVDARAEGAPWAACGAPQEGSHKAGFAQLWESINGPGSWDKNQWVFVVEFRRLTP